MLLMQHRSEPHWIPWLPITGTQSCCTARPPPPHVQLRWPLLHWPLPSKPLGYTHAPDGVSAPPPTLSQPAWTAPPVLEDFLRAQPARVLSSVHSSSRLHLWPVRLKLPVWCLAQNSPLSSNHVQPTDTFDDISLRRLKGNLKAELWFPHSTLLLLSCSLFHLA